MAPLIVRAVSPKGVPPVALVSSVAPLEPATLSLRLTPFITTVPPAIVSSPVLFAVGALSVSVLPGATTILPGPLMVRTRFVVTLSVTSNWPPLNVIPPGWMMEPTATTGLGFPKFATEEMLTTPLFKVT